MRSNDAKVIYGCYFSYLDSCVTSARSRLEQLSSIPNQISHVMYSCRLEIVPQRFTLVESLYFVKQSRKETLLKLIIMICLFVPRSGFRGCTQLVTTSRAHCFEWGRMPNGSLSCLFVSDCTTLVPKWVLIRILRTSGLTIKEHVTFPCFECAVRCSFIKNNLQSLGMVPICKMRHEKAFDQKKLTPKPSIRVVREQWFDQSINLRRNKWHVGDPFSGLTCWSGEHASHASSKYSYLSETFPCTMSYPPWLSECFCATSKIVYFPAPCNAEV